MCAGGWPQLEAAVQNGADAVYFGLNHFNARYVEASGEMMVVCRKHVLQWMSHMSG